MGKVLSLIKKLFSSLDFWQLVFAIIGLISIIVIIWIGICYFANQESIKSWFEKSITDLKVWELCLIILLITRID